MYDSMKEKIWREGEREIERQTERGRQRDRERKKAILKIFHVFANLCKLLKFFKQF